MPYTVVYVEDLSNYNIPPLALRYLLQVYCSICYTRTLYKYTIHSSVDPDLDTSIIENSLYIVRAHVCMSMCAYVGAGFFFSMLRTCRKATRNKAYYIWTSVLAIKLVHGKSKAIALYKMCTTYLYYTINVKEGVVRISFRCCYIRTSGTKYSIYFTLLHIRRRKESKSSPIPSNNVM